MKKLLITSSFLILSSTVGATSVGGSIGGWNVVSQVANGIGQKLTATKNVMVNGASKVVTGTANLTPNPGNMARFMAKAGGAAVVINAMDLVLDGVDYVMDPVNNTVTYKDKNANDPVKTSPQIFQNLTFSITKSYSHQSACSKYKPSNSDYKNVSALPAFQQGQPVCYYTQTSIYSGTVSHGYVGLGVSANPEYDPSIDSKPKTVPLSDVSSQVLDQAETDIRAGNPASPAVALSRAVAQDMAAEAETDDVKARPIANQFEQTQAIPTDEDSTGTIDTPEVVDPVTGEVVKPAESASISMKWPKACDWFPQACVFIDWAMTDPNVDDEEVPEKELDKQEIDEDLIKINNRSCPADVKFDVTGLPFGIQINKGYNMQEICNTVEPLKYVFEAVTLVLCGFMLLRV